MTPAHTDTPLRRSGIGVFRETVQHTSVAHQNDDEAERREHRRRTLMDNTSSAESTLEEAETLNKCLEIFNSNKMSRENAWSLSVIDTLSSLLDRHHHSLNNFKMAGSSLEASSKVYSLRVDCVHSDVMRMTAGLNAKKFVERLDDDEDEVATGGEGGSAPSGSAKTGEAVAEKPKKRQRKAVATITKNKDTLNAKLETVPLQDSIFGKLNSIVSSLTSSLRLMNNILITQESELKLAPNFQFWDSSDPAEVEGYDYIQKVPFNVIEEERFACNKLLAINKMCDMEVRPLQSGYTLSNTPLYLSDDKDTDFIDDDAMHDEENLQSNRANDCDGDICNNFPNCDDMEMAFDMNAECEPLPALDNGPMLAVDEDDFENFTPEDHTAVRLCRGLRMQPIILEDLRPVDSNSNLEYSYRPLDKISQFWAGPSHWKFKRGRTRGSSIYTNSQHVETVGRALNPRAKRVNALQAKKRSKINFCENTEDEFVRLDKVKNRKTTNHKKWDQRRQKLPNDLQLNSFELFFKNRFAPSQRVEIAAYEAPITDADSESRQADLHFNELDDDGIGGADGHDAMAIRNCSSNEMEGINSENCDNQPQETLGLGGGVGDVENACNVIANETVLEIATDFEGAPTQVTRIIVPFARRAKRIDMKHLKKCCARTIVNQLREPLDESLIPSHPILKDEKLAPGAASFVATYKRLPQLLSRDMTQALSRSIAFYSVLHLSNEYGFRLIPQEDLEDFKIRQIIDG